jgi:hypothetical protein
VLLASLTLEIGGVDLLAGGTLGDAQHDVVVVHPP